jgi:hypothetical protein
MNTDKNKNSEPRVPTQIAESTRAKHPIHPYFISNSAEETIRRMRGVRERIAKFEAQLDADRKSNKS